MSIFPVEESADAGPRETILVKTLRILWSTSSPMPYRASINPMYILKDDAVLSTERALYNSTYTCTRDFLALPLKAFAAEWNANHY